MRMHDADYAVTRCLPVRPSHAGIVEMAEHIINFFRHRVAIPCTLDFTHQTFRRGPLTEASDARSIKNCDFRLSRFISEIIRDRTI